VLTALRRTLTVLALAAAPALPCAAIAAAPVSGAPVTATTQGIIMRDGGICDPIRHMGC
jgi:hypothetical protein